MSGRRDYVRGRHLAWHNSRLPWRRLRSRRAWAHYARLIRSEKWVVLP